MVVVGVIADARRWSRRRSLVRFSVVAQPVDNGPELLERFMKADKTTT
jgi:hypothetical protein